MTSTTNEKEVKDKLPGTGHGTDGTMATVPLYKVPRAEDHYFDYIREFTKVHTFLSYGYAPAMLSQKHGKEEYDYVVTPLLELPVDRPYFYMSPLEYSTLPPGDRAIKMTVQVYQRNVRVAFPTNTTKTELATLNQNKNGVFAVGLNKLGIGFNGKVTASVMVPTAVQKYDHCFVDIAYGTDSTVGCHAMKTPWAPVNYFTMSKNANARSQGWPVLQNHFHAYDATQAVNSLVCDYEYEPSVGILKPAIATKKKGNPDIANAKFTLP